MRNSGLTVRPLSGAIGAEISGVDLSQPPADSLVAEIRAAWLEHLVVFFRGQELGSAQLMALAQRFGEPMEYPFLKGLDGFPRITAVIKRPSETVNFGGVWHSDTAYLPEPPMATLLIAREVPAAGGDTLFANGYLAYETLSNGMKRILGGLRAVNSSAEADASRTREDRIRESGRNEVLHDFTATHPVVRTHPETGRKALYVNPAHTQRLEGLSEEESAPILHYLFAHQVRPEFTCRFSWTPGAIALWDNRCALHNPVNDYHGHLRVMHRITLKGDMPV